MFIDNGEILPENPRRESSSIHRSVKRKKAGMACFYCKF